MYFQPTLLNKIESMQRLINFEAWNKENVSFFRLSQNIAGVTILAFGNGAPDIFSALASVQQARPELLLGGLFGAGIFVTTGKIIYFLNKTFKFPVIYRC